MKDPAVLTRVLRWSKAIGKRIAREDPWVGISALGRVLGAFAHTTEMFGLRRAETVIADVARDAQSKVDYERTTRVAKEGLS
jgi:hypothetical protein